MSELKLIAVVTANNELFELGKNGVKEFNWGGKNSRKVRVVFEDGIIVILFDVTSLTFR